MWRSLRRRFTADATRRKHPYVPRLGVAVTIFSRDLQQVLLIERGKRPRLGDWTFPGGIVDVGESIAVAARREALEETGLKIDILNRTRESVNTTCPSDVDTELSPAFCCTEFIDTASGDNDDHPYHPHHQQQRQQQIEYHYFLAHVIGFCDGDMTLPNAGDDAAQAKFFPIRDILNCNLDAEVQKKVGAKVIAVLQKAVKVVQRDQTQAPTKKT